MSALAGYLRTLRQYLATPHGRHDARDDAAALVRNALFGVVYFGSALLPWLVAAAALWAGQRPRALGWALIAIVYGAAVFWLTRSVNVPINDALAGWNPAHPPADWASARERWNAANAVRAWASAACFAAAAALTLCGRSAPVHRSS